MGLASGDERRTAVTEAGSRPKAQYCSGLSHLLTLHHHTSVSVFVRLLLPPESDCERQQDGDLTRNECCEHRRLYIQEIRLLSETHRSPAPGEALSSKSAVAAE